MVINAVAWDNENNPTLYRSGAVYTTINDKQVWVGSGYEGSTVGQVCRQAFINAQMRHMVASLGSKFSWSYPDLPLET